MAVLTSRDIETVERVTLDLTVPAGRIEVDAGDYEQTRAELSPLTDDSATLSAIEKATVELRGKGEVRLVIDVPSRHLRSDAKVLVRVTCPEGLDLRVKSGSAEVEARGRLGAVRLATASGDIRVDNIGSGTVNTASGDITIAAAGGDLTVNTASGNIEAGRLEGDTRIRSASGDVRVDDVAASLSVHTASGDQHLAAVRAGAVKLRTASGDLSVGIRQGSTLWLDARSMSGDMSSEIQLGDGPAQAPEGAPHVELHAVSMSGDVRVVRAPA